MSKLSLVCAALLAASLVMACGDGDEPKPRYNPPGGGGLCGNGNIDGTEQCDGTNHNGATCSSRGFTGGTLTCSSCSFVTTGCTSGGGGSVCGDGNVTGAEWCEPTDTFDCANGNLGTGTVTCSGTCTLVVSGCTITDLCEGFGYYGDGYCDDCAGTYGGITDTADCGACVSDGVCADWYDTAVGGYTCLTVNGALDPDCGTCGDNTIFASATGTGEFCDGTGTGGPGCTDFGFSSGTMGCTGTCGPDFSGCIP